MKSRPNSIGENFFVVLYSHTHTDRRVEQRANKQAKKRQIETQPTNKQQAKAKKPLSKKMASVKDTASFFAHGNSKQFEFCLGLYPQVLKVKAEKRTKKPEELIKLDDW